MKNLIAVCLLLVVTVPLYAVENDEVLYTGGTIPSVKQDTTGRLVLTSETTLVFEFSSGKLDIPYARIDSWSYYRDVAHHLGVAPAIAVGLVKRRERKHFFRISYRDESGTEQVAIFEVSKKMPRILQATLDTRVATKAGSAGRSFACGACAVTQGTRN